MFTGLARISGINIPDNKKVEFALVYIYGIGPSISKVILRSSNVDPNKKAKDLTQEEITRIQNILDRNYTVEGDLRRQVADNVKHLKEIGTWRGNRLARRLPVHGRSKTNSRTARTPGSGPNIRRTMGSGRKPTGEKT